MGWRVHMVKSLVVMGALAALGGVIAAQQPTDEAVKITANWSAGRNPLKTTPTLQVVVNPLLRRGSTIHDAAFANLKSLGANYVRYVPWHPYPRLAVAELKAPTKEKIEDSREPLVWTAEPLRPIPPEFFRKEKLIRTDRGLH